MATMIEGQPIRFLTTVGEAGFIRGALRIPFLLPVLAALIVVILAFQLGTSTIEHYYQHHPFAGDTFSYYGKRLAGAERIATEGRMAAVDLYLDNPRDPLRSLSLALYPSDLRSALEGALLFNGFAYLCFAATLSLLVARRTGLEGYGLSVAGVGLTIGIFFDPIYGYPSELPDLPAALFVGAALFALLLSDRGQKPGWLVGFAIFASLATLTRISAAVYLFVLAAPILAFYLWHIGLSEGWGRVMRLAGIIGLTLAILIGWFLWHWLLPTLEFYRQAGYALDTSPMIAAKTTVWPFFLRGLTFSFASFALLCLVYLSHAPQRGIVVTSLFETAWLVLATPLFLVFWLKLEDDITQMYYALPGLILLAVAPVALSDEVRTKLAASTPLRFGLPMGCLLLTAILVADDRSDLVHRAIGEQDRHRARFIRDLAEHFTALKPAATEGDRSIPYQIDVGFNYASRYVVPMMRLAFDESATPKMIFMIRESQWQIGFYRLDDVSIKETLRNRVDVEIDVMAVLAEPEHPSANIVLKDQYTVEMAKHLRDHLRMSTERWRPVGEVSGPYGLVEIYLQKQRPKPIWSGLASRLDDIVADAEAYLKVPERDSVTIELGLAGRLSNDGPSHGTGLTQEIFQRLGAMSIEAVADIVTHRLRDTRALVAMPIDLNDPAIAPMLLNESVKQVMDLLAKRLQNEDGLWIPWDRVETPFGSFLIYGNTTLLTPRERSTM